MRIEQFPFGNKKQPEKDGNINTILEDILKKSIEIFRNIPANIKERINGAIANRLNREGQKTETEPQDITSIIQRVASENQDFQFILKAETESETIYVPEGFDYLGAYQGFIRRLQEEGVSLEKFVKWKNERMKEAMKAKAERQSRILEEIREEEKKNRMEALQKEILDLWSMISQNKHAMWLFTEYISRGFGELPQTPEEFVEKYPEAVKNGLEMLDKLNKRLIDIQSQFFIENIYNTEAYEKIHRGTRIEISIKSPEEINNTELRKKLEEYLQRENVLENIGMVMLYLERLQEFMELKRKEL